MALIPVWNSSYYSYTSKTLLGLCAAIMQWSHSAKLLRRWANSHDSCLSCPAAAVSCIHTVQRGKRWKASTHIFHTSGGSSLERISRSSWNRSVWAVCAGSDSSWLPVRLVKVDVEGSSPVCKHRLLRDEAVVASSSAPLVGEIHGALVGPQGLVVMIRQRGMRGGSTGESRGEEKREAWKSKCEGGMWKIEMRVGGSQSQWGRNGTKKNRKIRRFWAHRCVHYPPSYSSDIHSHARLSGRRSYTRVTSVFLCEYTNCPLCPCRFMWEQY